jgi:hypothetical protein
MNAEQLQLLVENLLASTAAAFVPHDQSCRNEPQTLPPPAYYLLARHQKQAIQTKILDGDSPSLLFVHDGRLFLVEKIKKNDKPGYQIRSSVIPEAPSIVPHVPERNHFSLENEMTASNIARIFREHPRVLLAIPLLLLLIPACFLWSGNEPPTTNTQAQQPLAPKNAIGESGKDADIREDVNEFVTKMKLYRDEFTRMNNDIATSLIKLGNIKADLQTAESLVGATRAEIKRLVDLEQKAQTSLAQLKTASTNANVALQDATGKLKVAQSYYQSVTAKTKILEVLAEELPNWCIRGTYTYKLERK